MSVDRKKPVIESDDINRYWLQRWDDGDIGWHHQEFNPHLTAFWHQAGAPAACPVLVPLCGKSRDMVWLAQQGHTVVGVELSPLAVETFFEGQGLTAEITEMGSLQSWQAGSYQILCGDIFELQPEHIAGIGAVYDRASLVAFNASQRKAYADLLGRLLPTGTHVLLVTMEYTEGEMQGPPYSVDGTEVVALFGERFSIELLDSRDLLQDSDRYADRGLSRLLELVYRLNKQ